MKNTSPTSRDDLLRTPLSQREHETGGAFVKIVSVPEGAFSSAWRFDDIRQEPYGVPSKRPFVYFNDMHETVEKGLWCYLNGMTRLLGESNPEVSLAIAEKFKIDSLIADAPNALLVQPYFSRRAEPFECISIIGDVFDTRSLQSLLPYAKRIRLVLALPETGVIAEASLGTGEPVFKASPDCVVEHADGELVVTKLRPLITPIIRYRTGIPEALVAAA